ncbi:MAG: DNA polymerase III subunit delta [Novosphingopyxis baekryungensis]|nr:DNA polymerase III subunit delta [Novosphingopyxis baekryungensis]
MSRSGGRKLSERDLIAAIGQRPDIRLFLLFGTDPSTIEDIARKLSAEMKGAERLDLDGAQIRSDPALLADEAASISLFGDKRYIRLRLTRDEGFAAIENLLDAAEAGSPVIATTGNLTPTNKLRKLGQSHPGAMMLACYPPTENDAIAHVARLAEAAGLRMDRDLARLVAESTGFDRTLAANEIDKIALYCDAALDRPATVDAQTIALLSAETLEEDISGLLGAVMAGNIRATSEELSAASQLGVNEVRIVKALQRRVVQLAGLRAEVDEGAQIGPLVDRTRSIFFKEQGAYKQALSCWSSPKLTRLNARLFEIEQRLMSGGSALAGPMLANDLLMIARAANPRGH